MKRFKSFALLTTGATYLLIFIGGLVRVSGAGLGCPDWPKCFGRWIPPTDISQLPPEMDPNLFNFTLAWIEYINRLAGVTVGLLIATLAIWALVKYRHEKRILIPALSSAVLVAFQGWQGSHVVSSGLEPFIVTIHMGLAFVIVSLLLYVYLQSYLKINKTTVTIVKRKVKFSILVLYLISIAQIVVGTQIRSQIEHIQKASPLMPTRQILELLGFVTPLHIVIGLFLIVAIIYLQTHLKWEARTQKTPANFLITWGVVLLILQGIVGLILFWLGLPALGRVVHLWLSSLLIGVLLTLFVFLKPEEKLT